MSLWHGAREAEGAAMLKLGVAGALARATAASPPIYPANFVVSHAAHPSEKAVDRSVPFKERPLRFVKQSPSTRCRRLGASDWSMPVAVTEGGRETSMM